MTSGETPLFVSSKKGSLETVRYVRRIASEHHSLDCITYCSVLTSSRYLIQNGAEVNGKDAYNRTALYIAAFQVSTLITIHDKREIILLTAKSYRTVIVEFN